ncbi:fibronectin type 3 and ankyrin repeat domains protein 1 [Ischnura elegans]|uniref:fibronectin type 3 and ankyrin repeat domains protein 1 n=1 Tax=Ischnura elegans TaxID=197161 RepID=UPI001ED8A17D|nr:fibronectin type 3 and ankyrin repeat domains protein 1 [Ischnura elegans]
MKRLNPVIKSSALNSISLEWEPIEKYALDGNGKDNAEKQHLYTVQYCVGGDTKNWVNAYRGHKPFQEIKNLEPGNYYNIRVGFSISAIDKVTWSKLLIATTKEEPVAITDIQEAIQKGNLSSLRHLISSRLALVDIYNTRGLTPLMEASATGDIGAIGILLWAGSTVDQGSAGVGKTALMISLQNGHIKSAMKLCEAGAQWESKDRRGCTPLHYAVEASQVEAVRFALVNGANLEAKDNYGWTPLMRAQCIGWRLGGLHQGPQDRPF